MIIMVCEGVRESVFGDITPLDEAYPFESFTEIREFSDMKELREFLKNNPCEGRIFKVREELEYEWEPTVTIRPREKPEEKDDLPF